MKDHMRIIGISLCLVVAYLLLPYPYFDWMYRVVGSVSALALIYSFVRTKTIFHSRDSFFGFIGFFGVLTLFGPDVMVTNHHVGDAFYFDVVINLWFVPMALGWLYSMAQFSGFERFGLGAVVLWTGFLAILLNIDIALHPFVPDSLYAGTPHILNLIAMCGLAFTFALAIQTALLAEGPLLGLVALMLTHFVLLLRMVLIWLAATCEFEHMEGIERVLASLYVVGFGSFCYCLHHLAGSNHQLPTKLKNVPYFPSAWLPLIPLLLSIPAVVAVCWWLELEIPFNQTESLWLGGLAFVLVVAITGWQAHKITTHQRRLEYQLCHDELTGLFNRYGWRKALGGCLALEDWLIYTDLNHFKPLNDLHGHDFGDSIIRYVAQVLEADKHLILHARFSGDEFLAVLRSDDAEQAIIELSQRLNTEIVLEGKKINLSAALGASLYFGQPTEDLLSEADQQMYRAKKTGRPYAKASGKGGFSNDRAAVLRAIDRSISDESIWLARQKIVDIHTQRIVGYECLMRLYDERGKSMPPSMFLPIARELGVLSTLTLIMTRQIREYWEPEREEQVHFNLPPDLAIDATFRAKVIASLPCDSVDRARITVEITEDAEVDLQALSLAVQSFREAGFKVAIDDFGHANSSLARLAAIKFDTVKLDRSLILASERGQKVILESVFRIASRLGADVIAEGIETEAQCQLAASIGIERAQGFLFSPRRAI
ncbi:MAG: bifunctional diguanylate cyclase/phosphodiesterase [Gammaproteobacteria bacterium]|nr:bifunctional diguanylate cyclase/phosphodiesterase [Gammaproteobacteria bacterium]